jgi:rSAM/selenodomain-associated transferase 1
MNQSAGKGTIMVFARAPVPGRTKTRLIPALGAEAAAHLHAYLIDQTLSLLMAIDNVNVRLWCMPSPDDPFFQSCAERYGVGLSAQHGDSIGSSMHHAFGKALESAPWAIVLGTDCPELQIDDVQRAIEAMQNGMDAVAGPAYDGGYYLLGLRQAPPRLFENIPWGTEQVWSMTQDRLRTLGWSWETIARRHDLDRPGDLRYLKQAEFEPRRLGHILRSPERLPG